MLSNQKIINEIKASQRDYVNSRPEMIFKPFVNNRAEKNYNLGDGGKMRDVIGGYKSLGQHPRYSNSVNGNTAHPDPLFGGGIQSKKFNTFSDFNNRGGAVLSEKMPLTGGIKADCDFYSESESDSENSSSESDKSESDYESESDVEEEGGNIYNDYESESDVEEEGGNIYNDYIKPAGSVLYNTGKEIFKDIVVPVGKEILKDTIKGVLMGAGRKGGLSGTKKEFIHILKAMYPNIDFSKKSKKELMEEIKKVIPTIENIPPSETKKRGRPKSDKPKAEPKKRGRPKSDKPKAEPKKRGRPSKVKKEEPKTKEPNKHLNDLEDMFKEVLDTPEPIKKTKTAKTKKPTRIKNRLTKAQFMKKTKEDLFFNMLKPDEKQKAYEEYKILNPMLEASFIKKYFEHNKDLGQSLFKKEGAGIKKIVGTKTGEKVRGDVVAEVMKKQGLSLGQASKYVSEHNLY
jgi:hypothetical protein